MMMLQRMGEMFLMGVNGACAAAGFALGCVAMLAVVGFIANIFGLLLGGGRDEEN